MDKDLRHEMHQLIAEAVKAVYDAHDAHPSRRVIIRPEHPFAEVAVYHDAKIVADTHATHNGWWPLGSCDGELFQLEWLLYQYEILNGKHADHKSHIHLIRRKRNRLNRRLRQILRMSY